MLSLSVPQHAHYLLCCSISHVDLHVAAVYDICSRTAVLRCLSLPSQSRRADAIYTLLRKFDNERSAYSSSGGKSSSLARDQPKHKAEDSRTKTYPSRTLDTDAGPLPLPAFATLSLPGSLSADTLNRSRTSPVFIDPRPAFCWVTTDEAMLSLKRCKLVRCQRQTSALSTFGRKAQLTP